MKSIGLDQMCNHLTVYPNVLINEVKQRFVNLFIQDWKNQLHLQQENYECINMILFMNHIWSSPFTLEFHQLSLELVITF